MEETVNMKTLATRAALAAAVFVAAACDSTGAGKNAKGGAIDDEDVLPAGVVEVVNVNHAPDGRVTYVLKNVSGQLQEDLTYRVKFHYAGTENNKDGNGKAFQIADDVQVSLERDLVLLKSDAAKSVVVDNPRPGQAVKDTRILVQVSPPVPSVARDAGSQGTFFLNHALECVGMASEDEIRAGNLWIELENVSDRALSELEGRAVFVDQFTKEKISETKWTSMPDLPQRGARSRVQFDLSGLGKVGNFSFLVKIRQQSL
jgi:hypothetical protein